MKWKFFQKGQIEIVFLFIIICLSIILAGGYIRPEKNDTNIALTFGSTKWSDYKAYGFYNPTKTYTLSQGQLFKLKQAMPFVIKGATYYNKRFHQNINPQIILFWYYAEVYPHDFYTYSNCNDQTYALINCPNTSSGGWQLGFGHQFAALTTLLSPAFTDLYPTQTPQQIGNNILSHDHTDTNFPNYSIDVITKSIGDTDMNWWASVLSRDPAISAYVESEALLPVNFNRNVSWVAHSSYYLTNWQDYSNKMATILKYWPTITQVSL